MSYTMTLDAPERVLSFASRQGPRFRDEIGALVVAILTTRMQYAESITEGDDSSSDAALAKWDALVRAGSGRLAKPYKFSRADAYDEELA